MEHFFTLPVAYNGSELELQTRLATFGYTYKFYVMVEKQEIVVERDDEMNLRIIHADPKDGKPVAQELLQAIVDSIEKLTDKK